MAMAYDWSKKIDNSDFFLDLLCKNVNFGFDIMVGLWQTCCLKGIAS